MIDIRAIRSTMTTSTIPIGVVKTCWSSHTRNLLRRIFGGTDCETLGGYCVVFAFMWRLNRGRTVRLPSRANENLEAQPILPWTAH
jgi:hypothetical protein